MSVGHKTTQKKWNKFATAKEKKAKIETLSITRIKVSLGLKQTGCQGIGSNMIL